MKNKIYKNIGKGKFLWTSSSPGKLYKWARILTDALVDAGLWIDLNTLSFNIKASRSLM